MVIHILGFAGVRELGSPSPRFALSSLILDILSRDDSPLHVVLWQTLSGGDLSPVTTVRRTVGRSRVPAASGWNCAVYGKCY